MESPQHHWPDCALLRAGGAICTCGADLSLDDPAGLPAQQFQPWVRPRLFKTTVSPVESWSQARRRVLMAR